MLYWTSSTICILRPLSSKIIYLTKKETWRFLFLRHFLVFEKSDISHISFIIIILLLLYMCIIRTCFPLDRAFLSMQQKHVFACFALSQLCISSFACKLLCRQSTLIAKVNSCINCNFCITIIMLHLSKIRGIFKL